MRRWSRYGKRTTSLEFARGPRRSAGRLYSRTEQLCMGTTSLASCAKCKHSPDGGIRCSQAKVVASSMDPKYGQVYADRILCFNQRLRADLVCGPDGKLWEAKDA